MTVLVTGGRTYANRRRLATVMDRLHRVHHFTKLVHGDANGADTLAAQWGRRQRGIVVKPYPADWGTHGKAAGAIRNQQMLDSEPGIALVIVFPGGAGTADMERRAIRRGISVIHEYSV